MSVPFRFGNTADFRSDSDKVVTIPSSIVDRDALFSAYVKRLGLPDYFGGNWDAFSECLRDLSWVGEKRVVIVHEDVPQMEASVLSIYVDVLRECVLDWEPDEEHELVVVFPKGTVDLVELRKV